MFDRQGIEAGNGGLHIEAITHTWHIDMSVNACRSHDLTYSNWMDIYQSHDTRAKHRTASNLEFTDIKASSMWTRSLSGPLGFSISKKMCNDVSRPNAITGLYPLKMTRGGQAWLYTAAAVGQQYWRNVL